MEEQTGDTSSVSDWLPDRRIYPKLRLISGQWNPPCHDTVKRPRALSAEGGQVASSLPSSSWSNILFEPLGTKWHRRLVFQSKSNSTEVWRDETVKKDTQIWQYFFFFFFNDHQFVLLSAVKYWPLFSKRDKNQGEKSDCRHRHTSRPRRPQQLKVYTDVLDSGEVLLNLTSALPSCENWTQIRSIWTGIHSETTEYEFHRICSLWFSLYFIFCFRWILSAQLTHFFPHNLQQQLLAPWTTISGDICFSFILFRLVAAFDSFHLQENWLEF